MILDAHIYEKSFGAKELFQNVFISVADREKIGLIGRNGIGKTTLLRILAGRDTDFTGDLHWRRGTRTVVTEQEYSDVPPGTTVVDYILSQVPDFTRLNQLITELPEKMGDSMKLIREYSDALEDYERLGFYDIEDRVRLELLAFQMYDFADRPFVSLSGGQKRLSEVIKIMHSDADLAIVDEPTNFMDYEAKAKFIDWMKSTPTAIIIITHDRDCLDQVDRIVEIKDGASWNYSGSYRDYLRTNATRTGNAMNEYEVAQNKIANLRKQIAYARAKKPSWTGTADKRNPFLVMENRLTKELNKLLAIPKPSFWVDRENVASLSYKEAARYDKYKAKNIRIGLSDASRGKRNLIKVTNLSLGYLESPLFAGINFEVAEGSAVELRGRNGAGKTTLVKAIIAQYQEATQAQANPLDPIQLFDGTIEIGKSIRFGVYEQEVSSDLFDLTLTDAVFKIYQNADRPINETKARSLLSQYLFLPEDLTILVRNLSGGQKARLQIIKMLVNDPNLIILDEPTSHLDLPSIEELETALARYSGAILYISHDNYFRTQLGGQLIQIG
ncbi:ATP-binding cassette domain-containing protein [Candidatus Saccharibacteria bacterium]|nr:ATP-binding cassette domain-containing protein [Candidatus Saccharibacteria bacterium]